MDFISAYSEKKSFETPAGREERETYGYKVNKAGVKELVVTGMENVYDKIQEYLEETKIENVLARVIAGDTSMLRPDGIYSDVSKMPKNLIEAYQQITELENLWNSLPVETRNAYNNNVEEFVADAGSDNWLKSMGLTGVNVETVNTKMEQETAQAYGEVSTGEGAEA